MNGSDGDMGRVGRGFLRQREVGFQSVRQFSARFSEVEDRETRHSSQSLARGFHVASGGLIEHELGDVKIKAATHLAWNS